MSEFLRGAAGAVMAIYVDINTSKKVSSPILFGGATH